MSFHETIEISQNFSGITLGFCEVVKYFVDFWFCFLYFLKKRWLQNFSFIWTDSKFGSFKLGNGESSKSQYQSYLVLTQLIATEIRSTADTTLPFCSPLIYRATSKALLDMITLEKHNLLLAVIVTRLLLIVTVENKLECLSMPRLVSPGWCQWIEL